MAAAATLGVIMVGLMDEVVAEGGLWWARLVSSQEPLVRRSARLLPKKTARKAITLLQ